MIRKDVSPKRDEVIRRAYETLAERFAGEVRFENLVQSYDEKNHPDVTFIC